MKRTEFIAMLAGVLTAPFVKKPKFGPSPISSLASEIARIYKVPPAMLSNYRSATFDNIKYYEAARRAMTFNPKDLES